MYKKLTNGIQYHGFSYFIRLKITEQFYNLKFKSLSVHSVNGNVPAEVLNIESVNGDAKINQASPHYEIKKAFAFIGIHFSEICLLDIGCGFGRVLNWGMLLNFKEVIGIDLDPTAVERAISNCYQLQEKGYTTKFKVLSEDASKYTIPQSINVIYIANSFGHKTLEELLENIIKYYNYHNKKKLYIIYYIPAHIDLFTSLTGCTKVYERINRNKTNSEMAIFRIN